MMLSMTLETLYGITTGSKYSHSVPSLDQPKPQ